MDLRIVLRKPLVEVLDANVPRVDGAVDERSVGAVAERIGVGDRRLMDELALGFETLDDVLVAILAEASLVFGNLGGERAGGVERIDNRLHAGFLADTEVILTVSRRDMDDADAVIGRHVVVVKDAEGAFGLLIGKIREERFVLGILEFGSLTLPDKLVACCSTLAVLRFLEDRRKPRLGHHVDGTLLVRQIANRDIVDLRAAADCEVLRQGPRRRRPDEEEYGALTALRLQLFTLH